MAGEVVVEELAEPDDADWPVTGDDEVGRLSSCFLSMLANELAGRGADFGTAAATGGLAEAELEVATEAGRDADDEGVAEAGRGVDEDAAFVVAGAEDCRLMVPDSGVGGLVELTAAGFAPPFDAAAVDTEEEAGTPAAAAFAAVDLAVDAEAVVVGVAGFAGCLVACGFAGCLRSESLSSLNSSSVSSSLP